MFYYFKSLMIRGLIEVKKRLIELTTLIKIMAGNHNIQSLTPNGSANVQTLPCIKNVETLEQEITDRLSFKFSVPNSKNEIQELVERIISASMNNASTKLYD